MKQNYQYCLALVIVFMMVFLSCEDIDISESWAINKFREETGLSDGCTIDSVNRYGGQAIVYATISNHARVELENRFKFVSSEEFLKEYHADTIGYVPFFKTLYNLDSSTSSNLSIKNDHLYFLKKYTNSSGKIATSYYVTILSMRNNKIIFTEAFYDL